MASLAGTTPVCHRRDGTGGFGDVGLTTALHSWKAVI